MPYQYIIAAIAGYLIGNIQFAVIFSKMIYHDDVRRHGSGNAGTTNMLRVFGIKPGLITFVCDFMKGVAGVLIGRLIGGEVGAYICALFVVLGHDFPAFFNFRGGKGVASSFAILWMLNPLFAAIITAVAAAMLYFTRTVSITAMCGALLYFLLTLVFMTSNTALVLLIFILVALVMIRHIENIQRLIKGEESKLFEKKEKEQARVR